MKNTRKGITFLAASAMVCALLVAAGCAPQSPDAGGADAGGAAQTVEMTWSADMDCAVCHTSESTSMDDSKCLASTHQAQGTTCSSCHTDTDALSKAHEDMATAKMPTKLDDTDVENEVCLSCHGSWDELAAKTTGVTVLTDTSGLVVNPHSVMSAEIDVKGQHDVIDCVNCHSMHSTETAQTLAPEECQTCHHSNVYECYTCHD